MNKPGTSQLNPGTWLLGRCYLDPKEPAFLGFPNMISLYMCALKKVGYLGLC